MITESHPAFNPELLGVQTAELPRYRCHKEVSALKIKSIVFDQPVTLGDDNSVLGANLTGASITPEDGRYGPIHVDADYLARHKPAVGGYYVVYKDGYKSYSPADAFEDGYTLIQ